MSPKLSYKHGMGLSLKKSYSGYIVGKYINKEGESTRSKLRKHIHNRRCTFVMMKDTVMSK